MPQPDALDNLQIASPCHVSWDEMTGDDLKRFCEHCKLNVYNISGMSRQEAEDLISRQEGRLCVQFFRRIDGTVLTRDCPVGVWAVRRRVAALAAGMAGLVALIPGAAALLAADSSLGQKEPFKTLSRLLGFRTRFLGVVVNPRMTSTE